MNKDELTENTRMYCTHIARAMSLTTSEDVSRSENLGANINDEDDNVEESLVSKSKHKHGHRRSRHRNEDEKQKENVKPGKVNRNSGDYTNVTADSKDGYLLIENEQVEKIKRSRKKKKKRHRYKNHKEDDSQIDPEKIYSGRSVPYSFPEGKSDDIIELLQTRTYILDEKSCSSNIELPYPKRPDVARRRISKKTTDAIRGAIGFCNGAHTFEISFNDKPWGSHCAVGVCTSQAPMYSQGYCHMLGNSQAGWVWDIPSQCLYHDGQDIGSYPGKTGLEIPRTFKMTIDREQRHLAFDVGLGYNVVFKNLPDCSTLLYPVVSLVYGLAEVTVRVVASDLFSKYKWLSLSQSTAEKSRHCSSSGQISEDKLDHSEENKPEELMNEEAKHGAESRGMRNEENLKEEEICEEAYLNDQKLDEVITSSKTGGGGGDEDVTEDSGKQVIPIDDLDDKINHEKRITDDISESVKDISNESNIGEILSEPQKLEYIMSESSDQRETVFSSEEETDFDQESMNVADLNEEDQFLFNVAHGWDNTNKGSLIQPYPNAPHICVPLPNLVGKIQGIRCQRGFSGRSIHTWLVKELILFTSSVEPEHMAFYRNNVIIGVATNEQRKYNFGYSIENIGKDVWGFHYPDMVVHHGNNVYRPKRGEKCPQQVNLDKYDFELSDGLEMTLNTVTHRLVFAHNGNLLAELHNVKGEKLYPFVIFVKDAFYPLEMNYLKGPTEYFDEVLAYLGRHDKQEILHVRMIMKRSLSVKEVSETTQVKDKYTWGCHSPEMELPNRNTVCKAGIAVATYPLGGSRHKVKFIIEGSRRGICIGFVHYNCPLQPVIQESLSYLGSDLLSWCWDIDNRYLVHACKTISRYPVDEAFNQDNVIAYTLTLDFTPLGHNTASFTAHFSGKDQPSKELGIAFIGLPVKVLPTVVLRGCDQRLRMEYLSGPWKELSHSSVQTSTDSPTLHSKSRICSIM